MIDDKNRYNIIIYPHFTYVTIYKKDRWGSESTCIQENGRWSYLSIENEAKHQRNGSNQRGSCTDDDPAETG